MDLVGREKLKFQIYKRICFLKTRTRPTFLAFLSPFLFFLPQSSHPSSQDWALCGG